MRRLSDGTRDPFFAAVVLTLAIAAVAVSCGKKAEDEEIRPAEVPTITAQTARVARRDIARVLTVRGTIAAVPNEDVKISSLVPGRVVAVRVAEGDAVRAGEVVAEIDRRTLDDQRRQAAAAVDQAAASLENARLNLDRTEQLYQRGIAAGKEVEDARKDFASATAALEQARAALATATLQVNRARVVSPISGQVVKRLVSVGEQVDGTAAQPIIEVANLDRVELGASVPSEYLGSVHTGQAVAVATDAYGDRVFDGEVLAIAPAVDPTTNAALARIRIRNAERLLKVGMFAQARVHVEEHRGALIVPASAIVRDQRGAAVYVLAGDLAQRTPVKTGIETPESVEVVSGLSEGQTVLTSAINGLGDRARVTHGSSDRLLEFQVGGASRARARLPVDPGAPAISRWRS